MAPAPSRCCWIPASQCGGAAAWLLAVCLDQALHELVDVARLGQVALVQQVAQLGLGQALIAFAGLVMGVPGLLALGLAGLAGQFLLGLLGLLGLAGLLVHEVAGRPGLLADQAADGLGLLADGAGER